ncbi:MAG: glycosyltransferase family 4 protein [Gemmatimonadaceae bacterium]
MLCILHGWLLEGSGSNLWTRSVVRSLCRMGEDVHLVCQENHPDRYDFIAGAYFHHRDGTVEEKLSRQTSYPGKCILHQPELDGTLPVFVWDKYEQYSRVVPMIDLSTEELESYIERNAAVVADIAQAERISVIHANHAVLMPTVAERIRARVGIPFTVMPHGSDIEYAVKKDDRFLRYASSAFAETGRIFVIGDEMRGRVLKVFAGVDGLESKLSDLHLGVDTSDFEPIARNDRGKNISQLSASLAPLSRGKTVAEENEMLRAMPGVRDLDDLLRVLGAASHYDGKRPDENADAKLASVPWTTAPTLLFVGRLIAWKGIQSLVAALPVAMERTPSLRVVIVGHGPLREAMEAFIWALRNGRRDIVELIVSNGGALEGNADSAHGESSLGDVESFYAKLAKDGALENYFETAQRVLSSETAVFTGYLTHSELRHLFPCCDVGVFPSVVREAGPLVFLEALASGCFPLGTYFGGMAASIDAVAEGIAPEIAEIMKLDPKNTVEDLGRKIPRALEQAPRYREQFATLARDRYDWSSVSSRFLREMDASRSLEIPGR